MYNDIAIDEIDRFDSYLDDKVKTARENVARWDGARNASADKDFGIYQLLTTIQQEWRTERDKITTAIKMN